MALSDLDDNRDRGGWRWLAVGAGLLALAGCRTSVPTRTTVAFAPPVAPGFPAMAATAAAAGLTASSDDAPGRVVGGSERVDGESAGGAISGARASAFDDFGARDAGGHLNLFVDPALALAAQDPQSPVAPQQPREERWSDFLPLGRAEVLAAGYELPRAFGLGVAYTRLRRDIEVDEVRVGVDGAPPRTTDFLSVEADSVVDNVMGRLDVFVFPFWNVSLLGGWTWNESDSQVTVSVPFPGNPRDVTFAVPTRQDGPTWGFGTNLAAGYREWFISGDGTWIKADMQDFAVIECFLGSIRSGWNGKLGGKTARIWGGATYWDTATTIEGQVVTSDGTVHFAVDQGPVTPYSLQVGGSYDLDRGCGFVFEAHLFRDVSMIVVSATLRF